MSDRQNTGIPFPDELEHLSYIRGILEEAMEKAEADVDRKDREYMKQKRYMVEYRGEIDPHEMFQNELALREIDRTGAFVTGIRDRLARLKESPYFARIDFAAEGRGKVMKCYIGRFAFTNDNDMLIFDWRAPVASMFYDCEVGPAGYDAPMGRVDGQLTRKRQFKINGGVMEYALETSSNIQDDVLQRELSRTSDEKMKSIIATIQKEQNQIIRNEKADILLIQGVAGSGKTSIALHRIAFLLYRLKNRLSAQNITILSPNKVFADYISNVLPELGEEPVYELSFYDIAEIQLEGVIGFEPDQDPLENRDEAWAERARFKSTLSFVRQLDRFIERLPELVFAPADYTFGRFTASAEMIQSRFAAYSQYPVKDRLRMIADDIHDRFATDNIMEDDIPRTGTILKSLNSMLKVKSTLALYKAFYQELGLPKMFVPAGKKTLEWADVYPFLYLHGAYAGLRESAVIRHLVVDEMQDYTPVQYAVLNQIFKCQKTILGDYGQLINPNHRHSLEDLRELYGDAEFVELNTSYRSTCEIIRFARTIQDGALEPIERHGEEPVLIQCSDRAAEIDCIANMILEFEKSGHATLGIIARTNRDALALYEALAERYEIHLLSPESGSFANGVSVASIQMSKGLEFDQVIVADADSRTYATPYDRSLLYIACTRAMHKLALLYTGERTKLVGEAGREIFV